MKTILISQCLQNDFIRPIGKYDNLPNLLHIGYDESSRLVGNDIDGGPLNLFMKWLIDSSNNEIIKVHLRDWHNNNDTTQKKHLDKFGIHCIEGTVGAEFVFPDDDNSIVINSVGLNDFVESDLNNVLSKYENENVRIGLIGVWTEAKIYFTAYDIVTRYPNFNIAVCAALSASSSVHSHYTALNQLNKILDIQVFNSIGQFTHFLTWGKESISIELEKSATPKIISNNGLQLSETEVKLLKYVFRNSKEILINILDGGFSGNVVIGTQSIDLNGHQESKHVVKIGEQEEIGKERKSFEIIENVLGNNAPRIVDFADSNGKGIIKYRYASMGKGDSCSFQKKFCANESIKKIEKYLNVIFKEQLGKLYTAKTHEKMNLLSYYDFDKVCISKIKASITNIYNGDLAKENLIIHSNPFPNPLNFYENKLSIYLNNTNTYAFQSFVHGDLNGANIIIDEQDNVWIIDFFHTHRGHVLKDLIKLENDLLYIFSDLRSEIDFKEALKISKVLFNISDLQAPLPTIEETGITIPSFIRIYKTLCILRSFYSSLIEWDRNPLQLFIAQLRYSMHSITFDECNKWQKEWALYNSGHFSHIISKMFLETDKLRIDFISANKIGNQSVAITILPGRKDYSRDLFQDIMEIKKHNIDSIVTLVTKDEMDSYGVPDLLEQYHKCGIECIHRPVVDQKVPSKEDIEAINTFINSKLKKNSKILIHCVGGLGRSGLVAACYLKSIGYNSEDAVRIIRETRTSRAIESKEQEKFVYNY